jgi:hypothetical protein
MKKPSYIQLINNQNSSLPNTEIFSETAFWVISGTFLFLSSLYLFLVADPLQTAYYQRPVVLFTGDFFKDFLSWPQGPQQYAARILTMLYYKPWMGIMGIVAVFAMLIVSIQRIMRHYTGAGTSPMILVPVTILLGLHGDPRHFINYDLEIFTITAAAALITAVKPFRNHCKPRHIRYHRQPPGDRRLIF